MYIAFRTQRSVWCGQTTLSSFDSSLWSTESTIIIQTMPTKSTHRTRSSMGMKL